MAGDQWLAEGANLILIGPPGGGKSHLSALHSSARTHRCRRFACTLTGADARLAEKRGLVAPSLQGTFTLCHMPVSLALVPRRPPPPLSRGSSRSRTASPNMLRL